MAKNKRKNNANRDARKTNPSESNMPDSGLLHRPKRRRDRPEVMIALTLASLIGGLLLVINCDRTTHLAAAAQRGHGTSLHGWPLVYLERQFESLPSFLRAQQPYDWPFPAIQDETRTMNYRNLVVDIACALIIIALSFLAIRHVVFRYERWKSTWADN